MTPDMVYHTTNADSTTVEDHYCGEIVGSEAFGFGKMIYHNGDIYVGNWCQDLRKGKGIFTTSSRDVFEATWRNSYLHGRGMAKYANGDIFEGKWAYVYDGHYSENLPTMG
eukprot:gene40260-49787_t